MVLENLQRKADPAFRASVVAATVEIAGSTIGSTITSLVVFLPLFFLPDLIGVVFRDLAWAVSCSLLASFIVSISVVPVLYCRFGSRETAVNSQNRRYRASLRMVYRRPSRAAIAGLALLAAGLFSFLFLDRDWLNTPESSHYLVSIALPAGTTIEHQQEIARKHPGSCRGFHNGALLFTEEETTRIRIISPGKTRNMKPCFAIVRYPRRRT